MCIFGGGLLYTICKQSRILMVSVCASVPYRILICDRDLSLCGLL